MSRHRTARDTMGEMKIPEHAMWGAQTQRAIENFDVSSLRLPKEMRMALALIKQAAAQVNCRLGLLTEKKAQAIASAANQITKKQLNDQFPLDVFQTGSGTSWNMNVNEVIAFLANQELKNSDLSVHPNDDVNLGQSSNDVIPSAIKIAARLGLDALVKEVGALASALNQKADQFADIPKLGRTHLADAVPMYLGQEFSAFAEQIYLAEQSLKNCAPQLEGLALGGTAIGTGLNCHSEFGRLSAEFIAQETGYPFRQASNLFAAIASQDGSVALMGSANQLATALIKICVDLRLLASGPRGGFAEIALPALQPGSSIMPGKINPVMPEMLQQICAQVIGKNATVTLAAQHGPLELNTMLPLIAHEVTATLSRLTNGLKRFRKRCVEGIIAHKKQCEAYIEQSLAMVTPLALKIGYDKAAQVAKTAWETGQSVRQTCLEAGVISQKEAEALFNYSKMIGKTGTG